MKLGPKMNAAGRKFPNIKHQISNKSQAANYKFQTRKALFIFRKVDSKIPSFGYWIFGNWILPFDVAQGGEPVEPIEICNLVLGVFLSILGPSDLGHPTSDLF
jgi:hypothetical protein